ncbi:MAG: hypothetical protein AVDCRST_MAG03-2950 [uncultured Rubrobacteraceae bacterium]|uniref:Uncharacterized protein n=1 Tax=uncultured Rubrobacteraceae bacterium TaxID=349277 RepID=A0A6J4PX79_9ACTN|nr:MAG: hypothetical protein AVDCRST_MAG03-2950 [uncultured Rubrobacteraceae bacterium]
MEEKARGSGPSALARGRLFVIAGLVLVLAAALVAGSSMRSEAQQEGGDGMQGPSQMGEGESGGDDDVAPAPGSIGTDIPLQYNGPAPSEVTKELIGPLELLRAGEIDEEKDTVTLPLYRGELADGTPQWFVLTDTSNADQADALGLNHSAKLSYANTGRGTRAATQNGDGTLTFEGGSVDFSPEHKIVPGEGENAFPPAEAQPGSMGDEDYSPLVRVENAGDEVYNAPVIAQGVGADQLEMEGDEVDHSIVHDKVVGISASEGTVTLDLTNGFSFARPVLYLSFDSNDPVAAALEGSTLAPGLEDLGVGRDDSAFSAVERIFITANGPMGGENPQRQGLNSAVSGEGDPLNVFGGIPTVATDYSPMWDANIGEWTQEATDKGYGSRVTEEFQILGLAEQGHITGPGGEPYGSTGIIINCPIVMRLL